MNNTGIFTPLTINGVEFENRLLRSSVGGRMSTYDGTVTEIWRSFERKFAETGIAGIISTTFHVTHGRLSPFEYPSIAKAENAAALKKYIADIKANGCRYIVQLGDPGYATYSSLFSQPEDARSSSSGFDLAFGYRNRRVAMSAREIDEVIDNFAAAASRVRDAGADGIEITAAKGYLIHQFLNPAFNRRKDQWGGSVENRFRLLETIVERTRDAVGRDFLLGVRIAAADYNYLPLQLSLFRFPWHLPWREHWMGNDESRMLAYADKLRDRVDFLHVVSGYGFPNPRVVPGEFPLEEIKVFFNSTRHLSFKAAARATALNLLPLFLARPLMNLGWKRAPGINLEHARRFKRRIGLPVIVNGGFQEKPLIEEALRDCDMVSMARALIANPGLVDDFKAGKERPDNPCTYCNRCVGRTASSPLGCYEPARFGSLDQMQDQILEWNRP